MDQRSKRMMYTRRDFIKLGAAGMAAGVLGFPAIASGASPARKTVVLGIDGMDPTLLKRFIAEGRMPNAKRLVETGSFLPLRTTDPPQSPVAWSSFISGTDPGGHGIFDFIARDPGTMIPCLSTSRLEGSSKALAVGGLSIPLGNVKMVNLRKGPTFWAELQDHGIDCTVVRMPANFPPTDTKARTLSGLGTPDVHGSYGIFTYYTDEPGQATRNISGGRIEKVVVRNHAVRCKLAGPPNTFDASSPARPETTIPFDVFVDPEHPIARISIQDHEFILAEGEWSDWIRLTFTLVRHVADLSSICRFYLKRAGSRFALYVSPVNIDPKDPSLPISTPENYSRDLAGRIGDYYTQGMPADTSALSAGVFDDDVYREQASFVLDEECRMFEEEFGRFDDGFFFCYFSSLDLNSHAFWRTIDPGHPLYTPVSAGEHGDFLPLLYGRMDEVIGTATKGIDGKATVFVVSDHGFGSFRRQFNLNSWLLDSGYAGARSGARSGRSYFADISWSGTRAYGLGINGLYLNVKGRERDGTVGPGREAEDLKAELISRLQAVRDPETGKRVISNVYRREDIYSGPCVGSAPDLVVGYNRNYRASWDTVLGKYPAEHILDNRDPWSGDHATDSAHVPGVLLCNRPVASAAPSLADMAPTILELHGVRVPGEMTGKPVL